MAKVKKDKSKKRSRDKKVKKKAENKKEDKKKSKKSKSKKRKPLAIDKVKIRLKDSPKDIQRSQELTKKSKELKKLIKKYKNGGNEKELKDAKRQQKKIKDLMKQYNIGGPGKSKKGEIVLFFKLTATKRYAQIQNISQIKEKKTKSPREKATRESLIKTGKNAQIAKINEVKFANRGERFVENDEKNENDENWKKKMHFSKMKKINHKEAIKRVDCGGAKGKEE